MVSTPALPLGWQAPPPQLWEVQGPQKVLLVPVSRREGLESGASVSTSLSRSKRRQKRHGLWGL